jgi:class 3 adenylate cyclase/tetratricopeptide (TPR) repeat protein
VSDYPGRRSGSSVDELLDKAVAAINRGDRATATALAGRALAVDGDNVDAEDLLAIRGDGGEIRRLTILFADLVDSTVLSTRVEPETYHALVGRYREQVLAAVDRLEGHIGSTKGDGLLAVFGHPRAHEDDVHRAVQAGLEITRAVARLSEQARRRFGVEISVRVGVHRGVVYLDTRQDDVYGLAANLAARVSGLAPPGTVVVSDAVESLVHNDFDLEACPAAAVKGVDGLIGYHVVLAERSRSRTVTRGPLTGRDREQARLRKAWTRAQAGTLTTPGLVFRGEPGIGKTRLATVAAEAAADCGAVVLELVGSALHTDTGLYPVRTLLERRCSITSAADPGERLALLHAELQAVALDPVAAVPLLAPVLGISAEPGYPPLQIEGRKRYELIADAVQRYLWACTDDRPALLIAEDVHWFDPSTVEVLGAVLQASGGDLLVVATGRPGTLLPAGWPVKVLDLAPLTDEQTEALITALNPAVSPSDRAVLASRSDGIPFYIEQLVAGVGTDSGVPDGLYESLFARLRATANVMPVLQAAAAIGRHVDRALLAAVVELDEAEVDDVLDHLEDAQVLEPWGTDGWRFRHELLREVAAELSPQSVARGLHARIGDALVDLASGGNADWQMVAGHYQRAERFDDATAAYQRAAAEARGRGALAEAQSYLTEALALLERCEPGPARDRTEIGLCLRRGSLVAAAQFYMTRAAVEDFERCLQLGGTDLQNDELVVTLIALSLYYLARADLYRMTQVIDVLRAGLLHERLWFAPVVEALAGTLAFARGEFDSARTHFEETRLAPVAPDREIDALWFLPNDPVATAYQVRAWICLLQGDTAGFEADSRQALRQFEGLGFPKGPYNMALGHFLESFMRIEAGDLERAVVLAGQTIAVAQQNGFEAGQLMGTTQQAVAHAAVALSAGEVRPPVLSAHIATITMLLDSWHSADLHMFRTYYDGVLARLLIAAGQTELARDRLEAGLKLAADTGMCFYDAELLRLRARTHSDPDAIGADLAAALDVARRQGPRLFELRAALDDFDHCGEPARAAIEDVVGKFPANSTAPELLRARAVLKSADRNIG